MNNRQTPRKLIRGDFHIHSCFSPDSSIKPDGFFDRCAKVGINCVAITDHNTIEGALEIRRIAPIPVIVGEEISLRGGHILALFLEETVPPGMSVEETIASIRYQEGIADRGPPVRAPVCRQPAGTVHGELDAVRCSGNSQQHHHQAG